MKRTMALLACLLALWAPALALEIGYGEVWNGLSSASTNRAPIYESPQGKMLGLLEPLQGVLIAGEAEDGWYCVSLGGIGGYMSAEDVAVSLTPPEQGESRLLETHELEIAPGLEATVELYGGALRFGDNNDGYLCEIRVTRGEGKTQYFRTTREEVQVTQMAYLCDSVPQEAQHLFFDDVNMDGYQDIIALRAMGANDAYAVWYLYEPQTGAFIRNLDLGGFSAWRYKLQPESNMIINILHESAAAGRYETHQWQDGALVFIEGAAWTDGAAQQTQTVEPAMQPGQMLTYTYGGSEDDALGDIAVGTDGRIVMTGYTNSTDGTLESRTKKGRTGWALCVDADGEVLWSFCSRLGVHDDMSWPVIHEDGSVTLLLYAERDDGQEIELIRLDEAGEVVSRKTLAQAERDEYIFVAPWRTERGYVISRTERKKLSSVVYLHFLFDGTQDEGFDADVSGVLAAAGGLAVQVDPNDAQGWLCRMDEKGGIHRLAHLFDVREDGLLLGNVFQLLAMEDGGAVGCGYVMADASDSNSDKMHLTRWAADGSVIFERTLESGFISSVARIPGGFAATAQGLMQDPNERPEWTLMIMDETGNVIRRESLAMDSTTGMNLPIAALPDGSVCVLGLVNDGHGGRDARMMRYMP